MARLLRRILRALAGLQRGGEHPRIGPDRQRVLVAGKAARDGDELAVGPVRLRKGLCAPGRLAAMRIGLDPDLEDLGLGRLQIVLGMADAAARAHHLHVARFSAALVAKAVLMGDGAFAHVSDDLHVGMGMGRKAGVRCDLVVIPHPQGAVAHIGGIVVVGKREVMLGLQPAVVRAAEFCKGFQFDHRFLPCLKFFERPGRRSCARYLG